MAQTPPDKYPFKIVPFFYDYAFKTVVANDNPFSRKLIEITAELGSPVQRLEMIRNEFLGITIEARAGVYDVVCRDERLWVFILEMQKETLKYLGLRLMFYDFHFLNSQITKGEQGFSDVPPVICICILEESCFPEPDQFCWHFMFRDEKGKTLDDHAQVRLIELGKFPILRKDFHLVKTDAEKMFYTMKYAHLIDIDNPAEVPDFMKEPWLADAIQKLNVAKMDPEQRALLDMSIVKWRMIQEQEQDKLQEKFEEGELIGKKEGEKKGEKKGKKQGTSLAVEVIRLHLAGNSAESIAKATQQPLKDVQQIIRQFEAN